MKQRGNSTKHRLLGLFLAAAATLAIPASASAHPSVYSDTAVIDTNPAVGAYTLANQTRHVVTNHGFTMVLRETNGASDKGVVTYSRLPGDYRSTIPMSQRLAEGDTGAQPHATCRGVAALESESAVTGWQEADPFYNYVPFQKVTAGLEDDPSHWIAHVQTITTGVPGGPVDLSTVSDDPTQATTDLTTACTGLGGTFTPADQTQTSTASLNSGYANVLTAPLNAQILQLQGDLAAAQSTGASAAAAAAAENAGLKSENATLRQQTSALSVKSAGKGKVSVTGPAGERVSVEATVGLSAARKHGLRSTVVGKATGTIGGDGKAKVNVRLTEAAKKAAKKAGSSLKVQFEAVLVDGSDSASGRI